MARCVQSRDAPIGAHHCGAIGKRHIRAECMVAPFAALFRRRHMRAETIARRASRGLQRGHPRRMVPMRVGYQEMRDALTLGGRQQSVQMRRIHRAGVQDRHGITLANNPAIRAAKGERPRIATQHAAHARRGLFRRTRGQAVIFQEGNAHGWRLIFRIGCCEARRSASPAYCPWRFIRPRTNSRCRMYSPESTISTAPRMVAMVGISPQISQPSPTDQRMEV